jgi:hypothetical protein
LLTPAVEAADELDLLLAEVPDDRVAEAAVRGLVGLALRFRREVMLLLSDAELAISTPAFSERPDPGERLLDALSGRSARPRDRLRARMTLGAVVLTSAMDPDLPPDEMLEHMVSGALRLLAETRDP